MNEQMSKTDDSEDSTFDDLPDPAPAISAPRTLGAGRGVAWLALLLAAIALAAVAYTAFEDWRTQRNLELSSDNIAASIRAIATRIDASNQELAELKSQLALLAQADGGAEKQIDALTRDIEQRLQQLDALPVRTGNLEMAMAALQGVSTGARDKWLLGESEYYMQMANAQLQLAGNSELAALALAMADERIAQLANPALTNVRIAIADERAALAAMTIPDVEGITLQLGGLARVVASLPLRPVKRIDDGVAAVSTADAGAIDRAWNSVKQATSDMIKHRTADEQVMPLISPEAEYFLRTNLALQLQTARLALLRGERSVFAASITDAASWLETYFDAGSEPVRVALRSLNELGGGIFDVETPDISGSLLLLRQYNSISETAP